MQDLIIKKTLYPFLEAKEIPYNDFGTHSKNSVDYPDFAHPVAKAVEEGEASFGILLCGSANGVAITANKHQGIRAAVCWGEELAQLVRDFIIMLILFVSLPALSGKVMQKKWLKYL